MSIEEFKINIEGLLIELTDKKLVIPVIGNHFIKLYRVKTDISDYILTLYDFLESLGFKIKGITYWAKGSTRRLPYSEIRNIWKMGITDIDINFDDSREILTESRFDDIKVLFDNIEGILIELNDKTINYQVHPKDEIKMKMVSLAKETIKINISLKDFEQSKDIILTLIDYMTFNNFKLLPIVRVDIQGGGTEHFKSFNDVLHFIEVVSKKRVFRPEKLRLEFENMNKLVYESLPSQKTVDQLKALRRLTKGIDIGDRISDMNKQGSNL